VWNGIVGILICALTAGLAYLFRQELRSRSPQALLFIGFVAFAIGSAVLTGWGRGAWDANGVANANASRYTLFSSYLVYGILYLLASEQYRVTTGRSLGKIVVPGLICLVAVASNTYMRSIKIYREAHDFNKMLAIAYTADHTSADQSIYPNLAVVAELKSGLRRLRLGPYRGILGATESTSALEELARHPLEDSFHINGLRTDGTVGTILFAHPRSRFQYSISGPITHIRFRYGILDAALKASPKTDGVEFRVLEEAPGRDAIPLWSRYLNPAEVGADRGLQTIDIELHAAAGSRLIFETSPKSAFENDWAYWADLVLNGGH
jgi:hypothetical protein